MIIYKLKYIQLNQVLIASYHKSAHKFNIHLLLIHSNVGIIIYLYQTYFIHILIVFEFSSHWKFMYFTFLNKNLHSICYIETLTFLRSLLFEFLLIIGRWGCMVTWASRTWDNCWRSAFRVLEWLCD